MVAELVPYAQDYTQIPDMLNRLIIENRESLAPYFRDMPALPPLPSLAAVSKVIREATGPSKSVAVRVIP